MKKTEDEWEMKILFKGNPLRQKWYRIFLNRHKDITLREVKVFRKARTLVSQKQIKKWLKKFTQYLVDSNELYIQDSKMYVNEKKP